MNDVITAITTQITAGTLYDSLESVVPVIALTLPFALGLYFVRRAVKGGAKGKVKF